MTKLNHQTNLSDAINLYLEEKASLSRIYNETKINLKELLDALHNMGYYYAKPGASSKTVKKVKLAAEKYIELGYGNTTVNKIAKEFKIAPKILCNYITTYYKDVKVFGKASFNERIFDTIDTEDKAYWLGFIFADGTIDSSPLYPEKKNNYEFELSLGIKDLNHLKKFAIFMEYPDHIWSDDIRCRFFVNSKHLWNVLNNYGCTPQKSLTLKFPKIESFSNKELVKHFIRGYFDGDGYISKDKDITISILGTSDFLETIQKYLPLNKKYTLQINHPEKQNIVKYFSITGKTAFEVCRYLYKESLIYLDRKFERYVNYCRSYEESYELLKGKNGEDCDVNTVLSSMITKGIETV